MKRQLSHTSIFNFRLIGAMAGAISVVLYPLVAGAESTDNSKSEEQQNKFSADSAENKASKASKKYNRSKKLVEALEAISKNQNQNVIALKKAEVNNPNLPVSLQQLVDERNYAAEYILTALKTSESTDEKLPLSLQKLVYERNHAAENALIALKPTKVDDTKLSLVQKLKRNQITDSKAELVALEPSHSENRLLEENNMNVETQYNIASAIQSEKITIKETEYNASLQNTLFSINTDEKSSNKLQKIDSAGNYFLALEPFINEQKPVESKVYSNSEGEYLLSLEPFLNEQKIAQLPKISTGNYFLALVTSEQDIRTTNFNTWNSPKRGNYFLALEPFLNEQNIVEPKNNSNSNYFIALEPFLNQQQPSEPKNNSNSNYFIALEPFLNQEKPAQSQIQNISENETDVRQWFSQLVAINVFESTPKNQIPENAPTLIAKNWNADNLTNKDYSFTSLVAIKPSSFADNYENNSSEMKLAQRYNSFNSGDSQDRELNRNNILAVYSKSPFGLPQPENLNPNLAPNSTQYISQFPKDTNNSSTVVILSPTPDALVDVAATPIVVQFPVGNEVELRVNGDLSDRSLIGRTETDSETDLVTQTWYGVSLQNGENVISAQVIGSKEPPVTVKVMVRGGAQELKIDTVESRIPADGISTATIKGVLLDENGNRSNHDAVVTLATTAGEFVEPDFKPGQPGFQVQAKAGQFTATLKSGLDAKTVRIKAKAGKLEDFAQLQFQTALRPSLMTGVIDFRLGARGTDFYSRFKDFLPKTKTTILK